MNFVYFASLRCKFGSIITSASFVSSTKIECVSPPYRAGRVALTVSNNGVEFSTPKSEIEFHYVSDIRLNRIWPSQGVIAGGTIVSMEVENIDVEYKSEPIKCKFGTNTVNGKVVGKNRIQCNTPAVKSLCRVGVEVSINGFDFTSSGFIFEYIQESVIVSITPALGPKSGGTPIIVTGYNFRLSRDVRCRFGDLIVEGRWISMTEVECRSPNWEAVRRVFPYQIFYVILLTFCVTIVCLALFRY